MNQKSFGAVKFNMKSMKVVDEDEYVGVINLFFASGPPDHTRSKPSL